ncbi:hypothetical protein SAMN05216167_11249 [Spirosoma endophyticum]|uniref:Uncharacterized protein n=2 Tax=Spirosoma endophyticum TaxID=662367 RepID=A0A1I1Z8W4_9BACT|nr:hypothetical protein SAMN05216167_11249 [Spirosoma endophyticum]
MNATQAIKSRYPQATQIQFKTLVNELLWNATFTQLSIAYQTQVNATGIVSAVLKRLDPGFTPYQRLTDQLSIRGGTFSDLWAVDADTSSTRLMAYTLQGTTYQLTYNESATGKPVINLSPLPLYAITSLPELPQRIQAFFSTNSTRLRFQSGQVIQRASGPITYWLTAVYQAGYSTSPTTILLFFDEMGNLTWSGCNATNTPVLYKPNSQVGDATLLATTSARYPGFDQSSSLAFETYYDGLVSVRYVFQRPIATTTESWEVGAQWPTGQLVYTTYRAN